MGSKSRFSLFIRTISFVLIITFILQDIVSADPQLVLKSSTLAPGNLAVNENRSESILRFAKAHFELLASKDPSLISIEDASLYLLRKSKELALRPDEIPAITSRVMDGFVKISFFDGTEFLFYQPQIIPPAIFPAVNPKLARLFSDNKRVASDRNFGKKLRMALIQDRPKLSVTNKPVYYKDLLAKALAVDDKLKAELGRAISAGRKSGSTKIELLASTLKSELESGIVSTESLRTAAIEAQKAMLRFKWLKKRQMQLIQSFINHVKKSSEFKAELDDIIQNMPRDAWRTYVVPSGASPADREKYLRDNIRDVSLHLNYTIDNVAFGMEHLSQRLKGFCRDINHWEDKAPRARGMLFHKAAVDFFAMSENNVGETTSRRLKYLAERCAAITEMLGYGEDAAGENWNFTETGNNESAFKGDGPYSYGDFGFLLQDTLSMVYMFAVSVNLFAITTAVISRNMQFMVMALSVFIASAAIMARLSHLGKLNHYLSEGAGLLNSVPDRPDSEKEIERAELRNMFKEILGAYKLFFIRDLKDKRKQLLGEFIFPNIMPPEDTEGDNKKSGVKQSVLRSDIATELMIDIFKSSDPAISVLALEAVIERIAKYPGYNYKRLVPLLKKSHTLPRFSKALVDILINAEKSGENQDRFIETGKKIIADCADTLPDVRNDILAYLVNIAEGSEKEINLVHELLDRIGFFVTLSEEFPKISAAEVAETLINIRAQRKKEGSPRRNINVVFTGGDTMSDFLDHLSGIVDPEIWADIHVYQLCEYKLFPPEHEMSISNFLDKHLPAALPRENRHFINGVNPDPMYMKKLEEAGGVDVVVLGIGKNGRLGFNEAADRDSEIPGRLNETKVSFIGMYMGRPRPAGHGYTMSLADIAKSRNIFLLAEGSNKSEIIKKALFERATPRVPASALQKAQHLKVVLDIAAMDKVTPTFELKRKKEIRKLLRNDAMLSAQFRDSPVAQHIIDITGRIVASNPAESSLFDYASPDEILNRNILEFIHPDDHEAAKGRIASKFAGRIDGLPAVKARYLTKSGGIMDVIIMDRQILKGDRVIGIQSAILDSKAMEALIKDPPAVPEHSEQKAKPGDDVPAPKEFKDKASIENNVEHVVALLANTLISKLEKGKVVLAFDDDLGLTEEIRSLINDYVIRVIATSGSRMGNLKKIFDNLVLIHDTSSRLPGRLSAIKGKDGITGKDIAIMTTDSNSGYFEDFKDSFITVVNDSALRTEPGADLNYYPIIELIFFSIARMEISGSGRIEEYRESLWQWYRNIPNVERLDKANFDKIIYGDPEDPVLQRIIRLKLVPSAARFDKDEMRKIYERIMEFITKA